MKKLTIEFGADKFPLTWEIIDSRIANSWFKKLQLALPKGLKEIDRFYNFPNQQWDKESIVMKIADALEVIEKQFKDIGGAYWPTFEMTQYDMNNLHSAFSNLRGSVDKPSPYWAVARDETKEAIEELNILIHRLESYGNHRPRFVCTFNDDHKEDLRPKDYNEFTLSNHFGDMALNYVC